MADLQATRGGDYLNGKGTWQISGPARYQAELHAAVKDLAVYAPAYADLPFSRQPISGSLTLDWSGDGAPGAHSGAFQGTTARFLTKGGPAALARPVDLAADGTYSPESVSFRYLVLREGAGEKRHDALKLTGALPWTREPAAFMAGHWLDPARAMSVRIECAAAPLDLLASLAPALVSGAEGQVSGWLNAEGTLQAPKLEADLQLKDASFRPVGPGAGLEEVSGRVRAQKSVLSFEQVQGRWATNSFALAGRMALSDTRAIGLDLAWRGTDSAGVHTGTLDTGLGYRLTLQGTLGSGARVGGEISLLAGKYEPPLPGRASDPFAGGWRELVRSLPPGWGEGGIDVHVTATSELKIAGAGAEAGLTPDLQLTGTTLSPRLTGKLTLHRIPLDEPAETVDGDWYFPDGEAGTSTVSLRATSAAGGDVYLYGAGDAVQTVSRFPAPAHEWGLSADPTTEPWAVPCQMAAFVPDRSAK